MNIQLTKIPTIVHRLHLPSSVEVSEQIKIDEAKKGMWAQMALLASVIGCK
jgi:hypothetical protein